MIKNILMIIIGFFLLETLEKVYENYLKYSLKQIFLEKIQKVFKADRKQNEIPILPIFKILISPVVSRKRILLSLSDNEVNQRYKL
ncbi:DUF1563 domain-containing protein [Leptospira interrogans serovar Szwajizak]|uniref:DUF1563 domain-containing protein n=1 Tax=Leptospira interrogans TaxID=173 RepID=UPI003CF70707